MTAFIRLAAVAVAGVALWVVCTPSALAAGGRHCPGAVALQYGDTASRVAVQNISCKRAKRVIKAPATKLGYRCTNPFNRSFGSGGFIRCSKGSTRINFLYAQT